MFERRAHAGVTSVEFAVALPVLVVTVFAGIELSRAAMLRHTADHAAYIAARDAIVPGADADQVRQRAIDHLNDIGVKGFEVEITPQTITASTELVDVQVTIPASTNSFALPDYFAGNLRGRCRLVTERAPMAMSAALPKIPKPKPPKPPTDPKPPKPPKPKPPKPTKPKPPKPKPPKPPGPGPSRPNL